MISDANDLPDGTALSAGICVVGAGAVGIALALELAKSGTEVLLLEAGGGKHDPEAQDFYRGTIVDPAMHSPLQDYRERRLGGSTTVWGGRCMPFDPIDFERRDWIDHSGWPIDEAVLAPYYPAANRICEAGDFAYSIGDAFADQRRPMIDGFTGSHFSSDTLERFSCPTDFGRRYRGKLAAARTVRLVLNAAVTEVELNPAGNAATGLAVRNAAGARIHVAADRIVLASGGLETTRLMLASRSVRPTGIGNAHDVLGRYYMCHLAGTMGVFRATGGTASVWHGYDIADDGTYCRRRLALKAEAQRSHRIGNFVARLHHPRIADSHHGSGVLSALYLGRSLIPRWYRKRLEDRDPDGWAGTARHLVNVARGPGAVARFAYQMLVDRRMAERKFPSVVVAPNRGRFSLDFHAEQLPNPDSRVCLSDEVDRWGMPRLQVDWRYLPGDVATVKTALALLTDDLRASGAGSYDFDAGEVEREMTRYGAYGGHHIGTARMGTDPTTSVVDADCRVHGMANLYVAGAAVFPTSSQANPTLTAIGLGLRLAERLAMPATMAMAS